MTKKNCCSRSTLASMDIFKQLSPNDTSIGNNFTTLISAIEANGLTVVDLLSSIHFSSNTNLPQLSKRLGRSIREVEEFLNILRNKCTEASTKCSLKDRFSWEQKEDHFIPTGLGTLDRQMNGGIPLGEITEIFGASGCGKSQFLLQLCIYTQLVGDPQNNQCIYISTESPLETRRLQDMINHHNSQSDKKVLMDNISCIYCQDIENQDHTLFTQLPVKLSQQKGKIRTIIIDSISHHLRMEEAITNTSYINDHIRTQEEALADCKEYSEVKAKLDQQFKAFFKSTPKYQNRIAKTQYLMLLHRHLLTIAKDNNIAVITANQVSDHPENIVDLNNYEDGGDTLNLEYQLGQYSGWDNRSIFRHQQLFLQSQEMISSKESELAYYELLRSIDHINNLNKRQKTGQQPVNESEIDPRYHKHNSTSIIYEQYSNQEDLIDKLHKLENCETKKIVPTLGYQWGKNMVSRLMLMKTYKPVLKDKSTLADTYQPVDPVSKLTYDSLCEGFNLQTQTEGGVKRRADNDNIESTEKNNSIYTVESLIDGWSVERYVKVVASPYDLLSLNGMFNENQKIHFQITKNGITQI